MSEARIHITLDSSAPTAQALKDLAAGGFCKEDVVSTAEQEQWAVDWTLSRLVAGKKLLDVLVVLPTGEQHLIRWKSGERTACRAASVFYRLVVYGEGLVRKDVVQIEVRIDRLDTVYPKCDQAVEHGQLRALNSFDAIFEIARAGERNRAEKIRVSYFGFQLGDSQTRQTTLRMPHDEPLFT